MEKLTNEQSCFVYKLNRKFNKCISEYGLIQENDTILIGLSGGKDSLALVELLGNRMKIFKPKFSLQAVHITMENIPYTSDLKYLKNHCDKFNIPFHHISTSFDATTDNRKSPCFLCSWNRRKVLFETAKRLGCNKIALGHHQDDILTTLLMNMTFQGAFSTMPPLLKMNRFNMGIIRPMGLLKESDIKELAAIRSYKKQVKNCPYEKESHRAEMHQVLLTLEKMNPEARHSLWSCMTNIQTDYLPIKIE